MRRDTTHPAVNWSAKIAEADRDALRSAIGPQGAITWVIDTGLEKFLDQLEAQPDQLPAIHEAIANALFNPIDLRPSCTVTLRVRTQLYERFNTLLPEYGATTWFIRQLITAFLAQLEGRGSTLDDDLAAAVSHIVYREEAPHA